ncbi:hypothetical protein LFYK43_16230 [Ligilactobacillus salitolerans]|uniref:Flagellar FliJ protein n=1 Tax=Ligilactobacillus salitolerans TaxID=1808352 RepID=A0A401IUG0_9LACO|nr:hypothetical protein [Ligilactobacillus salitolerans]GBG95164.1 hypothetical protein LFYK43_16230 [Ligilactobacillus salitolerans]
MNIWDQKRARLEKEETEAKKQLDRILDDEQQMVFDMGQRFDDLMNSFYHFDHAYNSTGGNEFQQASGRVTQEFQAGRRRMQQRIEATAESKRQVTRYYDDQTDEVLRQKYIAQKDKD